MADHGLGRLVVHDPRDFKFPMAAVLPQRAPKNLLERYWEDQAWFGDQGQTPHCVGYGWTHWLTDGPVVHNPVPPVNPDDLYYRCKEIDGQPRAEEGSSVRSGAQAVQEKGWIESYHWAFDAETVARAVLSAGPVVVGTNWYEKMYEPNGQNLIKIGGAVDGGHCYLINGYHRGHKLFRIKNSWGTGWGDGGHAYMSFTNLDRLLREQGEACLAVEKA